MRITGETGARCGLVGVDRETLPPHCSRTHHAETPDWRKPRAKSALGANAVS